MWRSSVLLEDSFMWKLWEWHTGPEYPDSQLLTKKLFSSWRFWTVPVTPEKVNFLLVDEKWGRPIFIAGDRKSGMFIDYDCEDNKNLFSKVSRMFLLNASFELLIWSKENFPEDINHNINLNIDSQVTWATAKTAEEPIILHDLYKINYTWPVLSTLAGQWDISSGLVYNLPDFKYLRREDLQGLLFNAAVAVTETNTDNINENLKADINRHIDSIAKYNYALHYILGQKYNFTMQLHVTHSHGYSDSLGQFDGMLGMLQRREVDLGITSLIMLPQRLAVVDFTAPTWQFRSSIIFRHPRTTGTRYSLLNPFTKTVWLCTLISWALTMCTIQLVNRLEARKQSEDISNKSDSDSSWGASLLTIFGAISEQGSEMESKWITWRIVYLVTLVQVVLLNAYYGACMVSDLLQPPPKTIRTVHDLIKSKFQVGYVDNRHNREFFQKIQDYAVRDLYNKKMKSPASSTPYSFTQDVAIEKIHTGQFAIHDEDIALYPVIERTFNNDDKCAITEIVLFKPKMTYTTIQKGSPYRKFLTYGFRKLWDDGVMARELTTWRPEPPKCQILDKFYTVEMETVTVAFLILVFGAMISSAILFLERFQDIKFFWKKKDD